MRSIARGGSPCGRPGLAWKPNRSPRGLLPPITSLRTHFTDPPAVDQAAHAGTARVVLPRQPAWSERAFEAQRT
ncbi:hypothetical protein STVIR_4185 [Streptomyces viridochromogenes Tue57]|uniref:Uncharacterized protein n=1 Tax=Streptomyces viridochromogenes Tue57 TaxID=1160705 RepID=L8PFK0_STRVR|nr:hypothetical protein STVIR_4185 [Streptomyces viridochromogenes Tue57]